MIKNILLFIFAPVIIPAAIICWVIGEWRARRKKLGISAGLDVFDVSD